VGQFYGQMNASRQLWPNQHLTMATPGQPESESQNTGSALASAASGVNAACPDHGLRSLLSNHQRGRRLKITALFCGIAGFQFRLLKIGGAAFERDKAWLSQMALRLREPSLFPSWNVLPITEGPLPLAIWDQAVGVRGGSPGTSGADRRVVPGRERRRERLRMRHHLRSLAAARRTSLAGSGVCGGSLVPS
jgi:hypothetical protein